MWLGQIYLEKTPCISFQCLFSVHIFLCVFSPNSTTSANKLQVSLEDIHQTSCSSLRRHKRLHRAYLSMYVLSGLNRWEDIEKLNFFPKLEEVRLQGIPLLQTYTNAERRSLMIAQWVPFVISVRNNLLDRKWRGCFVPPNPWHWMRRALSLVSIIVEVSYLVHWRVILCHKYLLHGGIIHLSFFSGFLQYHY